MHVAFKTLATSAQPGDACFVHYSGHGCSIRDDDGDEEDGMDEALCPLDYPKAGVLRDDDVLKTLIAPMARGVTLTCVMDCCTYKQTARLHQDNFRFSRHLTYLLLPIFQPLFNRPFRYHS